MHHIKLPPTLFQRMIGWKKKRERLNLGLKTVRKKSTSWFTTYLDITEKRDISVFLKKTVAKCCPRLRNLVGILTKLKLLPKVKDVDFKKKNLNNVLIFNYTMKLGSTIKIAKINLGNALEDAASFKTTHPLSGRVQR